MLGIIGIPAGILLGVGVIALLVVILNALLENMLNGISFVYAVPWWVAVISAVMSAVIILFSTLHRLSELKNCSDYRNQRQQRH